MITMKTRIHRILDEIGTLAFAGVFDTLSAKLAQQAGFPMAFVSGYSVAATAIGEPDMGLLTQTEITDRARRICMSVEIPVIVDADTGYGNPLNVYRTVQEMIAAGAAGCFLEDQLWPKKCGHMQGKRVIEREDYVQKIRAAVEARGDHFLHRAIDVQGIAIAGVGIHDDRDLDAHADPPGPVGDFGLVGGPCRARRWPWRRRNSPKRKPWGSRPAAPVWRRACRRRRQTPACRFRRGFDGSRFYGYHRSCSWSVCAIMAAIVCEFSSRRRAKASITFSRRWRGWFWLSFHFPSMRAISIRKATTDWASLRTNSSSS